MTKNELKNIILECLDEMSINEVRAIIAEANLEFITEKYAFRGEGISIRVEPDIKRLNAYKDQLYIKVYNDENFKNASGSLRISMIDATVLHTRHDGKNRDNKFKMTKELGAKLNRIMNMYIGNDTVYNIIYNIIDEFMNGIPYKKYKCPDFRDFKYEE